MTPLEIIGLLTFTAAAAAVDARRRIIPNRLVVAGLSCAFAVRGAGALWAIAEPSAAAVGAALLHAFGQGLLGLAVCVLLPLGLYCLGGMGAGDVKLLAAVGAWTAAGPGWQLTQTAFLAAGAMALVSSLRSGRFRGLWARARAPGSGGHLPAHRPAAAPRELLWMPFGPAVFLAACHLAWVSWPDPVGSRSPAGDRARGALEAVHDLALRPSGGLP